MAKITYTFVQHMVILIDFNKTEINTTSITVSAVYRETTILSTILPFLGTLRAQSSPFMDQRLFPSFVVDWLRATCEL